jgi:hypothetical protein
MAANVKIFPFDIRRFPLDQRHYTPKPGEFSEIQYDGPIQSGARHHGDQARRLLKSDSVNTVVHFSRFVHLRAPAASAPLRAGCSKQVSVTVPSQVTSASGKRP